MAWTCGNPSCGQLVAFDDLNTCPTCGQEKQSWTLKPEQTRTLTIAAPKVRLSARRGETIEALELDPWVGPGIAWRTTHEASTLTKTQARRLMEGRELPRAHDLWSARMAPAPTDTTWTLTVSIAFEGQAVEERVFEFEPRPDDLDEEGRFAAHFLCVHGPGAADDITFPRIHVLDVTEGTPLGHAPLLEVSGFRVKKPIPIRLAAVENDALECARGRRIASSAAAPGVAWSKTTAASALSPEQVRDLKQAGLLPDPRDLLRVRLKPGERPEWRMRLTPAGGAAAELQFTRDPEALDDEGRFAAHFLFVRGATKETFPFIRVIDVGQSASLTVGGPELDPIELTLEASDAPLEPREPTWIIEFTVEEPEPGETPKGQPEQLRFDWKVGGPFGKVRLLPYDRDVTSQTPSTGEGGCLMPRAGVDAIRSSHGVDLAQRYTLRLFDRKGVFSDEVVVELAPRATPAPRPGPDPQPPPPPPPPPPRPAPRPKPAPKPPEPPPGDPKDLALEPGDLELLNDLGDNEAPEVENLDYSALRLEKEIELKGELLPEHWLTTDVLRYVTLSGNIELGFDGNLFTFPGQEGAATAADLDRLSTQFKSKWIEFNQNPPSHEFKPVKFEIKPKAPIPLGKSWNTKPSLRGPTNLPTGGGKSFPFVQLTIAFELSLGERNKFAVEVEGFKFEKKATDWGPVDELHVGVIKISGQQSVRAIEVKVKNERGRVVGVVKGNLVVAPALTIKPNWKKIIPDLLEKVLESGEIEALGLDLSAEAILDIVITQPELVLLVLPLVIIYEFVKLEMDWADVRQIQAAYQQTRTSYTNGVIDGFLDIKPRMDNKIYDAARKHGATALNKVIDAYGRRFMENKTNAAWAKTKSPDELEATVKRLVLGRLIESPVPFTLAQDLEKRMLPGWRHDFYYGFWREHRDSSHHVRDTVFLTLYRECVKHDDYQAGLLAKLVPDDVFFTTAEPDAWYNHPPRQKGKRPIATQAQRTVAAEPAPQPGQALHSPRQAFAGKQGKDGKGALGGEGDKPGKEQDEAILVEWARKGFNITLFGRYPDVKSAAFDLARRGVWRGREGDKAAIGIGQIMLGPLEGDGGIFGPVEVNFSSSVCLCFSSDQATVLALNVGRPSTLLINL